MKVFVTGGMGFIGSHLVVELLRDGHEVSILARNPDKVPVFRKTSGITVIEGGLTDFDLISARLPGHDALIHNALHWGNTATLMLANDTTSSVKLFEAAAESGIRDVVYTSSTAALGDFQSHMDEDLRLTPADFYGATKAATEGYLLAFAKNTPMRCNVVRPGYTVGNPIVTGAPIESDRRFREIVKNALSGEDIHVTEYDGTQFIWASDLAKIYTAILRSEVNRSVYYGLASNFTSWEQIAKQAVEITGDKSRVVVDDRGYDRQPHLFDLSKIKREFGLQFDSTACITSHLHYLVDAIGQGEVPA